MKNSGRRLSSPTGTRIGPRTLKSIFSIDLRTLGLFRMGVALVLLYNLATRAADFAAFHMAAGATPPEVARSHYQRTWCWSLCWLSEATAFQYALLALATVAGLALLVGWRTRITTMICWLITVSFNVASPPLASGGDNLLALLLFWGMFLPLGARWSLDARRGPRPDDDLVFSGATIALLLQIALMYFFTGIAKWNDAWLHGTALREALSAEMIVRPLGRVLREFAGLTSLITYATLLGELVLPFVLFSPWRTPWCRGVALFILACLHVGIELTVNVQIFSFAAVSAITAFVPGVWWERRPLVALSGALDQIFPFGAVSAESRQRRRQKDRAARRGYGGDDRMAWLARNALPLVCLAYVFGYLVLARFATPEVRRNFGSYQRIGEGLSLRQEWRMFAEPGYLNKDFACVARLRDGSQIDFFRGNRPVSDRTARPDQPAVFPAGRWKQLVNQFVERRYARFQLSTLRYLCRQWNSSIETPDREVLECRLMIYPYGAYPQADKITHAELFHLDLRAKGQYVAGIPHGPWQLFHDNGTKWAQGVYNRGRMHGKWKFWNANGVQEAEGSFVNGKRVGNWKIWSADGQAQTIHYSPQRGTASSSR